MVKSHSHIFETIVSKPFQNNDVVNESRHSCISAVDFFDMLSLENIISDIVPSVSNKQEKIGVNLYSGYDFV